MCEVDDGISMVCLLRGDGLAEVEPRIVLILLQYLFLKKYKLFHREKLKRLKLLNKGVETKIHFVWPEDVFSNSINCKASKSVKTSSP